MTKKRIIWIIAAIAGGAACLCLGVVGYVVYQFSTISAQVAQSAALVGNPAPDFTLSALDQGTVRLSGLQDKPVILCFGTTWCPDCLLEAPLLQQIHEQHADDVTVLWVDSKEDTEKVARFMQDQGLTFKTLLDPDGRVSQQYMVWAVPMVYVIDTNGVIQARFVERLSQEEIDETLGALGIEP